MMKEKKKLTWLKITISILLNNLIILPVFIILLFIIVIGGMGDPNAKLAEEFLYLIFIMISEYLCFRTCLKFLDFNKSTFKKKFVTVSILNIFFIVLLFIILFP